MQTRWTLGDHRRKQLLRPRWTLGVHQGRQRQRSYQGDGLMFQQRQAQRQASPYRRHEILDIGIQMRTGTGGKEGFRIRRTGPLGELRELRKHQYRETSTYR